LYQLGDGPIRLAFIGGIHGGYEWNTILLAYEVIDYFTLYPEQLPADVSLYIIPVANPDGQAQTVGHTGRFTPEEVGENIVSGRLNGNGVDLNRNWDCEWQPMGYWRDQELSAGTAPFSEVETKVLQTFLTDPAMDAVIFWHSAFPGVFFGECETQLRESENLADIYAEAAEYPLYEEFTAYDVTGASTDWLALQGIPAIAVELTNHRDTDWQQNLAGILAVISVYSTQRQERPAVP
jgi:predicted deacylase